MCRMRVLFTRYACGHNIQEFAYDQRIDCEQTNCKVSPSHNPEPHDCLDECTQWMRQPETFFPWSKNTCCPGCAHGWK